MQDVTLLKITVVKDASTGIWSVEELQYAAMLGPLQLYLENSPENRVRLADWLLMLSEKCRNDEAPFQVGDRV